MITDSTSLSATGKEKYPYLYPSLEHTALLLSILMPIMARESPIITDLVHRKREKVKKDRKKNCWTFLSVRQSHMVKTNEISSQTMYSVSPLQRTRDMKRSAHLLLSHIFRVFFFAFLLWCWTFFVGIFLKWLCKTKHYFKKSQIAMDFFSTWSQHISVPVKEAKAETDKYWFGEN